MNPIVKNILAVVAGLVVGSAVNMGLIMVSSSIIPPPDGVDVSSMESLKANMHLFEPRHFVMPFLAHALGTLAGAFITSLVAAHHKITLSLAIGVFFLIGGIINVFMLPSPAWFTVTDLVLAYLPLAWLSGKMASQINFKKA